MDFAKARFNMVEQQIRPWDVLDFDLLDALQDLPRELFVSEEQKAYAYSDTPLPLPNGGTMLEPKIVARLVQGLALQKTDSVLEIGTGSGYATALLAKLCGEVTTIDLDADQQVRAKMALTAIAQENVIFQTGDGLAAAVGGAPFDAIYVGGSLPRIPEGLKAQLKDGGRLVAIIGNHPVQRAQLLVRQGNEFIETTLFDTKVPALSTAALPADSTFSF